MKKITLATLALALIAGLVLMAGCGGDAEATTCTGCDAELDAAEAKMVGDAMYCAGCAEKKADEAVTARHDCAGGCGMNDWPEDQMTEIDGKWYCKGCADKAGDHGHDHDHDHGDHDGHDHG